MHICDHSLRNLLLIIVVQLSESILATYFSTQPEYSTISTTLCLFAVKEKVFLKNSKNLNIRIRQKDGRYKNMPLHLFEPCLKLVLTNA